MTPKGLLPGSSQESRKENTVTILALLPCPDSRHASFPLNKRNKQTRQLKGKEAARETKKRGMKNVSADSQCGYWNSLFYRIKREGPLRTQDFSNCIPYCVAYERPFLMRDVFQ